MQEIDKTFAEEYKAAEQICRERLAAQKGFAAYLDAMKENAEAGMKILPTWERDRKIILHLHNVRVRIARAEEGQTVCDEKEIGRVRAFHAALLAEKDPLSVLKKTQEKTEPPKPAPVPEKRTVAVQTAGGIADLPVSTAAPAKKNVPKEDIPADLLSEDDAASPMQPYIPAEEVYAGPADEPVETEDLFYADEQQEAPAVNSIWSTISGIFVVAVLLLVIVLIVGLLFWF